MKKKLEIEGIEIIFDTAYEEVREAFSFLEEPGLHVIGTVTKRLLYAAKNDSSLKEAIRRYDMLVPGEVKLLRMAGVDSAQLMKEVRSFEFFTGMLERLVREKTSVFLLSDTAEKLELLKGFLTRDYGKLLILGEYALAWAFGDQDKAVNEINAAAPDVILSAVDPPEQEMFLLGRSHMMMTRLWYGIGDFEKLHKELTKSPSFFRRFVVD